MTAKASLVLALLLLVGTQLAASKSVDEAFEDGQELVLSKRAANEESKEEEATTLPSTASPEDEETTPTTTTTTTTARPQQKPRRRQKPRSTTPAPTTPEYDYEEEEDEAPTVKPLADDKPNKPRPQLFNRVKPDDESGKSPAGDRPALNLAPPITHPSSFFPTPSPLNLPWAFPHMIPSNYPYPSQPAFSDHFGGHFASASAGGSGTGSVSTSSFPGGSSSSSSSSSSSNNVNGYPGFAGGSVSASFPGNGQQPTFTSSSFPGGKVEKVQTGSFIGLRGSFGPDDDSVAIEVDGPAAAAGASAPGHPVNTNSKPLFSPPGFTGPTFGGFTYNGVPNISPYYNTVPIHPPYTQADFQYAVRQYLAFEAQQKALQQQQLAFQQQLQAQIQAQQQAIWDQSNRVDSNFFNGSPGFGAPGFGYPDNSGSGNSDFGSSGPQSASASVSLGPNGGFQSAQVNPAPSGIFSRFGESIPPPSGGNVGVFSSSSSSSSVGPDGKQVSHKTATVGINDNGKVSIKTVHDP